MSMSMSGIAVVTGAGRGIGRAIAITLADRGCDVVVMGRAPEQLLSTAEEVTKRGRRSIVIPCDVSQSSEVDAAAKQTIADLGVPRIVVSNAGIVHRVSVVNTTEAQWDEVLDVNLKGTFLVTRAFLPAMLAAKKPGRFVAIGSISGMMGTKALSAYCASKWGTVGFVKALAEELRGTGLQSMCVMPGSVDTDMLRGSGFAPAMQPEDVANVVAYAALDAPDAMNGSCVEAFG
jgi:NAD(P)-dependent dehydrogenase (short-subunit alcohol dehydrogenase family)